MTSAAPATAPIGPVAARPAPRDILRMAIWCGLTAGWLEVATRIIARAIDPVGRLYMMSRHYVWTIPLANLLLFAAAGLALAMLSRRAPRVGGWLGPRLLVALASMPSLMVAVPGIYPWAWALLAAGASMRLVPRLEARRPRRPALRRIGLAAMAAAIPIVAAIVFGSERFDEGRQWLRPHPHPASPGWNVLLVVLDTVRADHLFLYGYPRDTSRALMRLAKRGVTFTEARATAPWTLASHASVFTGRLPGELAVKWMTPLTVAAPTLAEYLDARRYATAGFVANTQYCSSETGLGRGFAHYEDYPADLARLRPLRFALLFEAGWQGVAAVVEAAVGLASPGPLRARLDAALGWMRGSHRKDAAEVNRAFLDWLDRRPDPLRPYFAFLNYFDAHAPYVLPAGTRLRFGPGPRTPDDFALLVGRWKAIDKRRLSPRFRNLMVDSYDNCLGHLDDCLGRLLNELSRRGELDRTLVIVTADHGEELGDHDLFEHGESLYRPEIRVPLVIAPPVLGPVPRVVSEVVSLRDLPATIVDLVGLSAGSPFPGRSMAPLWPEGESRAEAGAATGRVAISELAEPNPTLPSLGLSPAARGPLAAFAEGEYAYIRNDGDGREELYDERSDPAESSDLARDPSLRTVLDRMRGRLDRARSGASGDEG